MNNPLTSLKEAALETAIKAFINHEIEKFGVVTELAINTSKKTMRAELDLRGGIVAHLDQRCFVRA